MKIHVFKLVLLSGIFLFFLSCDDKKDDILDPGTGKETEILVSGDTLKVNQFIADYVKDAYLWTSTIDWKKMDYRKEKDPFAFFKKMVYKEDLWSILTDDAKGVSGQFDGVSTTFGYKLILGRFSNSDALFAIILYVYPGTPAEKAGLMRGDILITIDGFKEITEGNYMDLYNASSLVLGKGILTDEGITMDMNLVHITAQSMYEDPVIKDTVIVKGANKIGYLCYADYTRESEQQLQNIFTDFKAKGVNEVVLDLRYNGGGYAETSQMLSSILAPNSIVKGKNIFLTQTWNEAYMAYFKKNNKDVNEYFMDSLSINMNLDRLYVLTSRHSASASEATLIGLKPYMDVVQIGDTTHGKYCGGALFTPEIKDNKTGEWVPDKEIENWGMYLMLYRYANKNGITSFTGGLVPDVLLGEEDYFAMYPFGDERDPLLGKAIEMITGEQPVQKRIARPLPPPYTLMPVEDRSPLNGKMIYTGSIPVLEK